MTYFAWGKHEKAIKSYERAIELGGSALECGELLAVCLRDQEKVAQAETKMDEVLEQLEREISIGSDERKKACVRLSRWYAANDRAEKALYCAEKAKSLGLDDHEVALCLLEIYLTMEHDDNAVALLESVQKSPASQEGPSMSERFIEDLIFDSDGYSPENFLGCFALLSDNTTAFDFFLDKVDRVIDRMKSEGDGYRVFLSTWLKGVALYYFGSQTPATCARGVECWQECFEDDHPTLHPVDLLAVNYFEQARAQPMLADQHLRSMTSMMESSKDMEVKRLVGTYLASYYAMSEKPQSVKNTMRPLIKAAFEVMSNETDEDDRQAYPLLAFALLHSGDYANALTAYSMILPESHTVTLASFIDFDVDAGKTISPEHLAILGERVSDHNLISQIKTFLNEVNQTIEAAYSTAKNVIGDQGSVTTGSYKDLQAKLEVWAGFRTYESFAKSCASCGRLWNFDNAMNACLYCVPGLFCDECLSKLQKGKLRPRTTSSLICKRDHKWLRIPAHSRQRVMEALNGRVTVGGRIENGARVGGETKTVGEWIAGLKEEWE